MANTLYRMNNDAMVGGSNYIQLRGGGCMVQIDDTQCNAYEIVIRRRCFDTPLVIPLNARAPMVKINIFGNVDNMFLDQGEVTMTGGKIEYLTTSSGSVNVKGPVNGVGTNSGNIVVNGNVKGDIDSITGDIDCRGCNMCIAEKNRTIK